MPRLFTALEIPSDIALSLSLKRGGLPGARWIDPENYHITLSFIGEVSGGVAREIVDGLGDVRGHGAVEIKLDHLDAFGGDKPRALIARVQPSAELSALKAELDTALTRVGLRTERRKFVPHVTLARLRGVGAPAVADYLAGSADTVALRFIASRFVLFSSKPSLGGGPYGHEQVYPLDGYGGPGAEEPDEDDEFAGNGLAAGTWS